LEQYLWRQCDQPKEIFITRSPFIGKGVCKRHFRIYQLNRLKTLFIPSKNKIKDWDQYVKVDPLEYYHLADQFEASLEGYQHMVQQQLINRMLTLQQQLNAYSQQILEQQKIVSNLKKTRTLQQIPKSDDLKQEVDRMGGELQREVGRLNQMKIYLLQLKQELDICNEQLQMFMTPE
jgi:hypothetical protein